MLTMLLAYDAAGNVVATLDYVVSKDPQGNVAGLIDFEAHERAGGKLLDVWVVSGTSLLANTIGSGTWPEWIGARAHDFRVQTGTDGRIAKLVHQTSGLVRDRATIEAAVAAVPPDREGMRDLRPIVGGPTRPLRLDDQGRTVTDPLPAPPQLPTVGAETFRIR